MSTHATFLDGVQHQLEHSVAILRTSLLGAGVDKAIVDRALRDSGLETAEHAQHHQQPVETRANPHHDKSYFEVRLPEGKHAGEVLTVRSPRGGRPYDVVVPKGLQPGTILRVNVHSEDEDNASQRSARKQMSQAASPQMRSDRAVPKVKHLPQLNHRSDSAEEIDRQPPRHERHDRNDPSQPQQHHHHHHHHHQAADHRRAATPAPTSSKTIPNNILSVPLFGNPLICDTNGKPLHPDDWKLLRSLVTTVGDLFDPSGRVNPNVYSLASRSPQSLAELERLCRAVPLSWRDRIHEEHEQGKAAGKQQASARKYRVGVTVADAVPLLKQEREREGALLVVGANNTTEDTQGRRWAENPMVNVGRGVN